MGKFKKVLILGGTTEAVELVGRASSIEGLVVINSLAGRTSKPVVTSENTRIGGFGGVTGLIDYLREGQIDLLVDATHPFAAQISWHAAMACGEVGIPRMMLRRPQWERKQGDRWIEVESNQAAARVLPGLATRVFLTIGRQELATFAHLQDIWFLMRMIDPPQPHIPIPPGEIITQRGPFSLEHELLLLQEYEIGAIVSKNSGGDATIAKIIAAAEIGLPVVMVQRPSMPEGPQVFDVQSAYDWLVDNL